jgi:DNA invertase Pin-like site-specific DNA recombinase
MGRLTLNVLLSFAQFEREVTGERIRDKIAASKRKGMWMGGFVPLGYEVCDRRIVIDERQAETVRFIFRRYQELGCSKKTWIAAVSFPSGEPQKPESGLADTRSPEGHFMRFS